MVHMSLQASLPPSYWRQIYSPFVSRWFRGFPKMVSSDIAVAGRCGAVAEGHGRAHHIQAPCGWRWFDGNCLQAQTSALGRQETRETRKMKITRRDLLRSASATWATTILSKPASAAAEFEFKLGVNTPDTHPLTLRLIEAGQENPLAQVSTGKLYEVQKYCALSNHCWSGYWIVANRRALSSLPPDLVDIVNTHFDAVAIRERADLREMDRSLQAELAGKGMTFNKPDPVQFRAALVKASFYTQWQKTYGAKAWARLEQHTGRLT